MSDIARKDLGTEDRIALQRASFIFALPENLRTYTEKGVIGHMINLPNQPIDVRKDGLFFIGSYARTQRNKWGIFGPFRQTGPQYYDETDIGIVRIHWDKGERIATPELCPYRIPFETVCPQHFRRIELGLMWMKAAKIAGIDPTGWAALRYVLLKDEQFEKIRARLMEVNETSAHFASDTVSFLDFIWTAEEIERDRELQDAELSSGDYAEDFEYEMMFGGEDSAADAYWEGVMDRY